MLCGLLAFLLFLCEIRIIIISECTIHIHAKMILSMQNGTFVFYPLSVRSQFDFCPLVTFLDCSSTVHCQIFGVRSEFLRIFGIFGSAFFIACIYGIYFLLSPWSCCPGVALVNSRRVRFGAPRLVSALFLVCDN